MEAYNVSSIIIPAVGCPVLDVASLIDLYFPRSEAVCFHQVIYLFGLWTSSPANPRPPFEDISTSTAILARYYMASGCLFTELIRLAMPMILVLLLITGFLNRSRNKTQCEMILPQILCVVLSSELLFISSVEVLRSH